MLILGRLSEGGPCGMKIEDRMGAPSWVEKLLAPVGGGGGSAVLPFPLPQRREPKGGTEGSTWYSCNLTGHITRKSRDSVRGVSESANCTWRENRGVQSLLFITKLANGATTYPGLHNHMAVRSKEYASPNPA